MEDVEYEVYAKFAGMTIGHMLFASCHVVARNERSACVSCGV